MASTPNSHAFSTRFMTVDFKPALIGLYSPAPGCGKTSAAHTLGPWGYYRVSFADPLREMLAPLLQRLGVSPAAACFPGVKEQLIPEIGKSPRDLLRTLGTEWGRTLVHPDLWMIVARKQIEALHREGLGVVIDDVRFPNEAALIKEMGGVLWRIDRPGVAPPSTHASDNALSDYTDWDYEITNSGTLEELEQQVLNALDHSEVTAL